MASGVSQDGWGLDPGLRSFPVPGTNVSLSLVSDANVGVVFAWVAQVVNEKVQALDAGQCGGYDKRPIGSLGGTTSNHRSGTAMDLNYSNWPQGADKMSAGQKSTCRAIISTCEGVMRWGGDYTGGSLLDQQHWELNTTDNGLIARIAKKVSGSSGSTVSAVSGPTPTATGVTTPAPDPLPLIGPAAEHALIPLVRASYFDPADNRLALIHVNGASFTSDINTAVTAVTMSFSSTQVGQCTITLVDSPDALIIASQIFAKGTPIDFGDQHLEVRGVDYKPGPGGPVLTVKARSRVVGVLKGPEQMGRGTWGEQDVSGWVLDRCREAGAIPVVQPDLGTLTFNRQETGDAPEYTWDVMQRAAQQVGCLCYEFEQIVTFGRPSWLATHQRARWWNLSWVSYEDYSPGLAGMPSYSWSADSGAESMQFSLVSADADLARPGDGVTLDGQIGPGWGTWMVNDVSVPVSMTAPVVVTCGRVVDPTPTPVPTGV